MKTLANLATRFVGTPLMMHPPKLEIIVKALAPRLGVYIDDSALDTQADDNVKRLVAHYSDQGSDRSFSVVDGVAIIPVQGTLVKRASGMDAWSGCCSYLEIQDQLNEAMNDTGVRSVMLDIDSPGGEVSGCFELSDYIYSLRGQKPIYAAANDCALSAAYAIASAADKIFVTRTGAVGSIGVYALHAEQAEYDKKMGVKYTYVYAGDHKVDGNPHEPLTERAQANIQTEVNREYGIFTETVSRNRGAALGDIVATKADLSWADKAVPMLADAVGTFDDAMAELCSLGSTPSKSRGLKKAAVAANPNEGERTMSATTIVPAASDTGTRADEEEMKTTKKPDQAEGMDPECDDDEETDESKTKKAGSVATGAKPQGTLAASALVSSRTNEDIVAISNLCKLAGVPQNAADFLTKKNASGMYLSVADVSQELANVRVAESEKSSIMNNVDTNNGGGGHKVTMDRIKSEADSFARSNRNSPSSNLYLSGQRKGTTPEQAFAAALESNPEAYAEFRNRHNAGALIQQLKAAGVKVELS